jgi:hypothetical protein
MPKAKCQYDNEVLQKEQPYSKKMTSLPTTLQEHGAAESLPPAFNQYYPNTKHTMSLTSLNACSTRGKDIPYQLSRYELQAQLFC